MSSSSSSSMARFFPFPIGAWVTLPLAEALALVAPLVTVEEASLVMRAFFVAGPVIVAAFRFEARREGSGALAMAAVVMVGEEASEVVVVAAVEREASAGGATAAFDERAEVVVVCREEGFRAFVASDDGAAVLARAPLAGRPALVASVLVRAFLVAGPPVASPAARLFGAGASMAGAISVTLTACFGFVRRTRSDGSTTRFALGARLTTAGAAEPEVASWAVGRGRGKGWREVEGPALLSALAPRT